MKEAGEKRFFIGNSSIPMEKIRKATKDKTNILYMEKKSNSEKSLHNFIFRDPHNIIQENDDCNKTDCLIILNGQMEKEGLELAHQKIKFGGTLIYVGRRGDDEHCEKIENEGFRIIDNTVMASGKSFLVIARKKITQKKGGSLFSAEIAEREDFAEIAKMRYDIYCEEMGCFKTGESEQEMDEYDEIGTHIILRKNKKIIGYFRLIPEKDGKFLMENGGFSFPVDIDRRKAIEASRMIVKKEERGYSSALALENLLLPAGEIWSKENGYNTVCFIMMENVFERKNKDWSLRRIGEPKMHHGKMVQPAIRII